MKLSESESSDGQQPESTTEPVAEPIAEPIAEPEPDPTRLDDDEIKDLAAGEPDEPEPEVNHPDGTADAESGLGETPEEEEKRKEEEETAAFETFDQEHRQDPTDAEVEAMAERGAATDAATVPATESTTEPESVSEPEDDGNSHLFAVRTTGGQEKIVMRSLEARIKMGKFWHEQSGRDIIMNIQSVLLLSDLKGYVVVEAQDASAMFDSIQGIRHVRGQLRGELTYNEIDKYLIKKSTVLELAVENTVEIIGGPFKGMKATITRLDQEKEEATVILTDASYQLPVTIDANYLKLVTT